MTGYIVDSSVPRSTAAYDMTSSECGEKNTRVHVLLRKLYTQLQMQTTKEINIVS